MDPELKSLILPTISTLEAHLCRELTEDEQWCVLAGYRQALAQENADLALLKELYAEVPAA